MAPPLRSIHVVAGVLVDPRGRVLLARRKQDSDLAGLWEFPGGKREPGESSDAALVRELHEELGIEAEVGPVLIEVPQEYPGKRLRLEVRAVPRWKGTPRGREGQALTWVQPEHLSRYSMPSADLPVVGVLRQPPTCVVTPEPGADLDAWMACLEQLLAAGCQRLQLRARALLAEAQGGSTAWRHLAEQVSTLCRASGTELLLNRDIALAHELGVGVQLGSEQLAALQARPLPAEDLVGASCHTAADLEHAQRLGCDFAVLGPLQATASHPGQSGIGWEAFERLRERVGLPIDAIGGLGPDDVDQARLHGAQGIAAIRALWPVGPALAVGGR
jgi:8-oxo-dGTP diphosphatase